MTTESGCVIVILTDRGAFCYEYPQLNACRAVAVKGAGAEDGSRQRVGLAAGNKIRVAVTLRWSAINIFVARGGLLCVVVAFSATIIFL